MSKRLIKIYCFMCTHLKSTVNLQVNRNLHNVLVHREEKRSENFHARERPRYLNGSDHLVWVEISSNYSNKCVLLSYSQSYCQFIYQRHFHTLYIHYKSQLILSVTVTYFGFTYMYRPLTTNVIVCCLNCDWWWLFR